MPHYSCVWPLHLAHCSDGVFTGNCRIALTPVQDTYEFKRDIIIGAENPRTGKVVAEKMIR